MEESSQSTELSCRQTDCCCCYHSVWDTTAGITSWPGTLRQSISNFASYISKLHGCWKYSTWL